MRVLVCGGRDYTDIEGGATILLETLSSLPDSPDKGDVVFISGLAKGADQIPVYLTEGDPEWGGLIKFPADWETYGKKAGPMRNIQMLIEGNPDLVIAFPGGSGTEHMKKIARAAKVMVIDLPKVIEQD